MRDVDPEIMRRARALAAGHIAVEKDMRVIAIATDLILADCLRTRKRSEKHGILSDRQLRRRRQREIYFPTGYPEYSVHETPSGRRTYAQRKGCL